MKLRIDPRSETWRFLEQHINERLQSLRLQNDAVTLDATATATLRGRIAELKSMLSLSAKLDQAPDASEDE